MLMLDEKYILIYCPVCVHSRKNKGNCFSTHREIRLCHEYDLYSPTEFLFSL